MRQIMRAMLVLWLPALLLWGPVYAETPPMEVKGAAIDRILNPLPEFDPFDTVPSPPRFFPDEVDRRVRRALIDSLTDRRKALEEHVRFFKEKDAELLGERGRITGVTDHVVDLAHNLLQDRQAYLAAQKRALASATSEQQKKLIRSRLRNDELSRAEELLKRSKTNRWGAVINRLLRSMDLVSILSGSYIGAAVDTAVPQILRAGSTSMSIEERKALALYLRYLKRYPNDPEREEVLKKVEALTEKKKKVLAEQHIGEAEQALSQGNLTGAEVAYEMAALIDPQSEEVKEGMKALKERIRSEKEKINRALEVPLVKDEDRGEDRDAVELLYALATRDPELIEAEARAVEKKHRGTPLGESAKEAIAVALEIKGRHEQAKEMLQRIAHSSISPRERKRAKALLDSPEYNLLASFHKARRQHRLETIRFVLLGENFLEKNLLLGAAPVVTQGLAGAQTFGAANVLFVGTNLFEVLTSNPISYQPIIEKGIAYVRNHPESENAADVYTVLAEAYEGIGRYDKAIAYYQMSGKASDEKIADLKDRAARTLLQAADRSQGRETKELYLKSILRYYPETAASQEATRKLSRLAKLENRGLRISKQFFKEHPQLYGPEGLGLKATLFDGNISNMELADKGISLLSDHEALLHFQTPWGVQSRIYPVRAKTVQRFELALRKVHYDLALGDIHARDRGSPGGIKDLPAHLFPENREGNGAESEPTNLALVKKAEGPPPEYPKVLDYRLLSENEKDPARKMKLPPMQGSISASGFDISGKLPTALWGEGVMVGSDAKSPFAGLRLPIPLLKDFIPVDFLLQGRPGRPSLTPQIHRYQDKEIEDAYLYR